MNINLERIDKDLHRRAKVQAAIAGMTLHEYVGQAILLLVETNEHGGVAVRGDRPPPLDNQEQR